MDQLQEKTGLDIPIHVDAASGGFIAPFAYPDFKWAFDVPRVVSINTSGHKFGLVYPGLGWILWRDEKLLHKDLIFELHGESYIISGAVFGGVLRAPNMGQYTLAAKFIYYMPIWYEQAMHKFIAGLVDN